MIQDCVNTSNAGWIVDCWIYFFGEDDVNLQDFIDFGTHLLRRWIFF